MFADDMKRFTLSLEVKTPQALVGLATGLHESIVNGSPETGSPGQPVDTGALRASWQLTFPDPQTAVIGTNLVYAPYIEEGVVPLGSRRGNATGNTSQRLTLRSAVGGFHSVALTIAGANRILESVMQRLGARKAA